MAYSLLGENKSGLGFRASLDGLPLLVWEKDWFKLEGFNCYLFFWFLWGGPWTVLVTEVREDHKISL